MPGTPAIVTLKTPPDVSAALQAVSTAGPSFCMDTGGRYTFIGIRPVATFQCVGGFITTQHGSRTQTAIDNPVDALRSFATILQDLPIDPYLPFYGGLVGYVGFEWGARAIPDDRTDGVQELPDAWLGLFDTVLVIDHVERSAYVASLGLDHTVQPRPALAEARAEEMAALVTAQATSSLDDPEAHRLFPARDAERSLSTSILPPRIATDRDQPITFMAEDLTPVSPRRRYRQIAQELKRCLWQGVAQRINLAPRYVGLMPQAPWAVHAQLRQMNPAPYATYLDTGGFQLCSLSPTSFLTMEQRELIAKPVLACGPYQNGIALPEPNDWLAETPGARGLLHRLREELQPLAEQGTVREDPAAVEVDARSVHLTCSLRARLRADYELVDALSIIVPGLSMTGFPKQNVVRLLLQHEPFRRHAYTGALGMWGPHGRAQFNLGVRLLTIREGLGYLHAANWLDPATDADAALEATDQRVAAFFAQLHRLPIDTIHEQSLY